MPIPDSSDYTRKTRLLTIISAEGTSRNTVTYYIPPITAAAQNFFLPRAVTAPPALPPSPSYSISQSAVVIDEGQSVTFTVTTTNVADGTTLYWTTSGTATGADFTDNADSGSFVVTSNSGQIIRTVKSDLSQEGSETFTLSIRTVSISGTVVATSGTVTINDTSGITFTWTQREPSRAWPEIRMSSDGNVLLSSYTSEGSMPPETSLLGPFISTDGGTTWTRKVTGLPATPTTVAMAIAKDSPNIMYVAIKQGAIFKSTNTGDNWTQIRTTNFWTSISCSSNGLVVIATAASDNKVYRSTNGGTSWSTSTLGSLGTSLVSSAVSAGGSVMYVSINVGGALFKSTNTGASWNALAFTSPNTYFKSMQCSSDGQVFAAGNDDGLFLSTDGVTTRTIVPVPAHSQDVWPNCIAVSSDGNTIASGHYSLAGPRPIYVSVDRGAAWNSYNDIDDPGWSGVAISGNGLKIVGGNGSNGSQLFVGIRA